MGIFFDVDLWSYFLLDLVLFSVSICLRGQDLSGFIP